MAEGKETFSDTRSSTPPLITSAEIRKAKVDCSLRADRSQVDCSLRADREKGDCSIRVDRAKGDCRIRPRVDCNLKANR